MINDYNTYVTDEVYDLCPQELYLFMLGAIMLSDMISHFDGPSISSFSATAYGKIRLFCDMSLNINSPSIVYHSTLILYANITILPSSFSLCICLNIYYFFPLYFWYCIINLSLYNCFNVYCIMYI